MLVKIANLIALIGLTPTRTDIRMGNYRKKRYLKDRTFDYVYICFDKPHQENDEEFPIWVTIVCEKDVVVGLNFRWNVFENLVFESSKRANKTYWLSGDYTDDAVAKLIKYFFDKREIEKSFEGIFLREMQDLRSLFRTLDPQCELSDI